MGLKSLQEWHNYYRAVGQISDFSSSFFYYILQTLSVSYWREPSVCVNILKLFWDGGVLQWWLTFRKLLPSAHRISAAQPQWPLSSWSRLLRLWPRWLSLVTQSALRRVQMSSISEWWRLPWSLKPSEQQKCLCSFWQLCVFVNTPTAKDQKVSERSWNTGVNEIAELFFLIKVQIGERWSINIGSFLSNFHCSSFF